MISIGLLHFYLNNLQCRHIVLGCYKESLYCRALHLPHDNVHTTFRITLLRSLELRDLSGEIYFDFEVVFLAKEKTPSKFGRVDNPTTLPPWHMSSSSSDNTGELHTHFDRQSSSRDYSLGKKDALAARQGSIDEAKRTGNWQINKRDLLVNVDGKRLDPKLEDVDPEVVDSMVRRLQEKRFCFPIHLQGTCDQGATCDFRHEPRLTPQELLFLERNARRSVCTYGSDCRKVNCRFGHHCPYEPGCPKGVLCPFQKFHGMDSAVVAVRRAKVYG